MAIKDSWQVMDYCEKNNLFTGGDSEQYKNMLLCCEDCVTSAHDIAVMIWICSTTEKSIEEIEKDITLETSAEQKIDAKTAKDIFVINQRISKREQLRDNASKMGWFKLASTHQEVIDELKNLKEELIGDSYND